MMDLARRLQAIPRAENAIRRLMRGLAIRWLRTVTRPARADLKTWPDYLLRDVGLPTARHDGRRMPMDWPLR